MVHQGAAPFSGMEINVVSETLTVHEYESKVLTKAFEEITGIKVNHESSRKADVVEKIADPDAVRQERL